MSDLYLADERYLAALVRQRERIAAGAEFEAVDSDAVGDKFTHASWGLCSKDAEAWPDAEDHLWPDQFTHLGRVAPKYRSETQLCPIQREGGATGCFYHCRIFKRRKEGFITREDAIALYDARIAEVREHQS